MKKEVPEIRFKGFSGEWLEREFSGIATRVSTQHQSPCLPCVEYEDIVAGKGRFNKDVHQKKTFKAGLKFEVDDVLFGKLRPYLKNWLLADFEGIAVGDFWVLRADKVASTFLFSLIQTNKFEFISNLSAGSKMPRSDWGLVSTSCFFVPKNISESGEIGNYFQKLDSLINQHQKKHDQLSNIKKAMLEKMFPKQGENIPEIRFKGFSGDWEEKGITDISKVFIGLVTTMTTSYRSKGVLLIRNSDIKSNRFEFSVNPIYLDEKFADENSSRRLMLGDVVTVHTGDVGTSAVVTEKEEGSIGFATIVSRPNKNIVDSNYLSVFLNTDIHKSFAINVSTGDGRANYNLKDFYKLNVPLPAVDEQAKIGNYFQKLDALINQHKQQITKLNNIKQACLSKMFV